MSPCRVCLVPHDFSRELLCTEAPAPLVVPPGRYDIRASSPGFALGRESTLVVDPGDRPDAERSRPPHGVNVDLDPGGIVAIGRGAVPVSGAVQLLSFETDRLDTLFLERESEAPFPAGRMIGIAFRLPNQVMGMTRPFDLPAGQRKVIDRFEPSAKGRGDLLIRIDYPDAMGPDAQDVRLSLGPPEHPIEPEASTNKQRDGHYSVFFGLRAGQYPVRVVSKFWRIDGTTVDVRADKVVIDDHLRLLPKPSLKVSVRDLAEVDGGSYKLSLYECEGLGPGTALWPDIKTCVLTRSEKAERGRELTFSGLDGRRYFLLGETGNRKSGIHVDLRDGHDRREILEFRQTRVHGRVLRGEKGIIADLTFKGLGEGNEGPTVRSGPDGSYEVAVYRRDAYEIAIAPPGTVPGAEAKFLLDLNDMPEDVDRDFVVPRGEAIVTVRDESSRRPIDGAKVWFTIAGSGEVRTTDALGQVSFPPLPAGDFKCRAEAKGYRSQDSVFSVADADAPQSFELLLKPLKEELSFRVVLPTGDPAGSPLLFARWNGNTFALLETCEPDGTCRFSEKPEDQEVLYLAHKDAGLTVVSAGGALEAGSVTMSPSGGWLIVSVTRGVQTSRSLLQIEVGVGGVLVPLQAMVFLGSVAQASGVRPMLQAGGDDRFVLAGLPAGNITCYVRELVNAGHDQFVAAPALLVDPFVVALPQREVTALSLP